MKPKDNEEIHAAFYTAHKHLYGGAIRSISDATKRLYSHQCDDLESRQFIRERIARLENILDTLSKALSDLGNIRSEIIREFGCDGTCHHD